MHDLQCNSHRDVFLLLKASELISQDIDLAKELEIPLVLNLVRFHKLTDGMIFRIFVKNSEIVGISQKSQVNSPFLEDMKNLLTEKILDFYNDVIEANLEFENYCFDLYIDTPPRYKC